MVKLLRKTCDAIGAATLPPWCPPSTVGLYRVISIVSSGSFVFTTPIKEVTYFPVFTPSSDVPVFPPMLYPSTLAFFTFPYDYHNNNNFYCNNYYNNMMIYDDYSN